MSHTNADHAARRDPLCVIYQKLRMPSILLARLAEFVSASSPQPGLAWSRLAILGGERDEDLDEAGNMGFE